MDNEFLKRTFKSNIEFKDFYDNKDLTNVYMNAFTTFSNVILCLFFICKYSLNVVRLFCLVYSSCCIFLYLRAPWKIGENQMGHPR